MKTDIALIGCVIWSLCLPGSAQEQQTPPSEVKKLEESYLAGVETSVTKPYQSAISELNKNYLASLDRARESAQQGERLDEALAIVAESTRIKEATPVPAEDDASTPASLKNLRSIYRKSMATLDAERAQRLRPLAAAYMTSLNTLIAQLTRAGNLEEAKAARDIFEKLQREQPVVPRRDADLKEYLTGTTWLWYGKSENEMTFLADGTIGYTEWTNKGLVTGWKVVGKNQVRLSILKGRDNWPTATLRFSDDRSSFTGTDFNGKAQIAKSTRAPAPVPPGAEPQNAAEQNLASPNAAPQNPVPQNPVQP